MHIPVLITDLAVMMLTAGIIAIIFKKIKQPLVLGYILAGFLMSRYFPWFTDISDTESIETWSEIGIIFLMFHLGLEFNLHKLSEVGSTAFITCIADVTGMMVVGYFTGQALGFTGMDSLVLGGMLAMSSTMVIIKVFDEKNIKDSYAGGVFGTLVIQDIVGIFMMVILSTVSVSKNISGIEVAGKLGLMLIYLAVWLVLGIYLLPTFLDKTIKYMNDEMLMVLSIGICLGMVLLANWLGFSSALGAFLSGSLLAGTTHVERIEHLTKGIKDLFGAVFFVSVGMMVDPKMIVKYIVPIIVIFIVTIVFKIVFNALGMIISGQSLSNSVKSGFALAQIGEFAFIIANLGKSLGVVDDFLYPIAVAVSVITIFTTPICIGAADPFVNWLEKVLPKKVLLKLDSIKAEEGENDKDSDWSAFIKKYMIRVIVFGGMMFVGSTVAIEFVQPLFEETVGGLPSKLITTALIYFIVLIFARPLLNPHSDLFTALWFKRKTNRIPLIVLTSAKYLIILVSAVSPIRAFFKVGTVWLALLTAALLLFIIRKGIGTSWYLKIQTRFLQNFNERMIKKEESEGGKQEWLDENLFIISVYVPETSDLIGKTLEKAEWGKKFNCYVVKIKKANGWKKIALPDKDCRIEAGDKLYIIGEKIALENFYLRTGFEKRREIRTLKEFMASGYDDVDSALSFCPIKLRGDESFCGKTIKQSSLRKTYKTAIIGMQKNGLPILMPDPDLTLQKGDILWVIGTNNNLGKIIIEYNDEVEANYESR